MSRTVTSRADVTVRNLQAQLDPLLLCNWLFQLYPAHFSGTFNILIKFPQEVHKFYPMTLPRLFSLMFGEFTMFQERQKQENPECTRRGGKVGGQSRTDSRKLSSDPHTDAVAWCWAYPTQTHRHIQIINIYEDISRFFSLLL